MKLSELFGYRSTGESQILQLAVTELSKRFTSVRKEVRVSDDLVADIQATTNDGKNIYFEIKQQQGQFDIGLAEVADIVRLKRGLLNRPMTLGLVLLTDKELSQPIKKALEAADVFVAYVSSHNEKTKRSLSAAIDQLYRKH